MKQDKNKKTPEPRMNEQDLREQVNSSPGYEGNRSQSELDGERNRRDEEEGSRHRRDKGHNAAAAEGRINTNQSLNSSDEAQNIHHNNGRELSEEDTQHTLNKATEGIRQGRDAGSANGNAERQNDARGK